MTSTAAPNGRDRTSGTVTRSGVDTVVEGSPAGVGDTLGGVVVATETELLVSDAVPSPQQATTKLIKTASRSHVLILTPIQRRARRPSSSRNTDTTDSLKVEVVHGLKDEFPISAVWALPAGVSRSAPNPVGSV